MGYGHISPRFLQKKYWQAARCNPQHHTGEYMAIYLEDLEGNPTELGKDNFLISGVHLYVIYAFVGDRTVMVNNALLAGCIRMEVLSPLQVQRDISFRGYCFLGMEFRRTYFFSFIRASKRDICRSCFSTEKENLDGKVKPHPFKRDKKAQRTYFLLKKAVPAGREGMFPS